MPETRDNRFGTSVATPGARQPTLDPSDQPAPFASFGRIQATLHDGWIDVVLDNGPSNYLDQEMASDIGELLAGSERESIHCVVIGGGDKRVFSRGLELKPFLAKGVDDQLRFVERANLLLSAIAEAPVPVICAVNGVCAGAGLELAIACDFRVASEDATFSTPEVGFGLVPGGGVMQRLLRQIGQGQCTRLLSSGTVIGAPEALRIGLVEEVVERNGLAGRLNSLARRLARAPRPALVAMKKALMIGRDLPMRTAVQADLRQSMDSLRVLQRPGVDQSSAVREPRGSDL